MSIILKELCLKLMYTEIPNNMKGFLLKRMGDIEYRRSLNCSEKLMLGSLVGAFVEARSIKQQ